KDYGVFIDTKFENAENVIDFADAKFGRGLHCIGAVFDGGAIFSSIQCEGSGVFRDTKFENTEKDIGFADAKFGVDLDCIGAIFNGGASFNGMQCKGGLFVDAKFENVEKDINFTDAKFRDLDCTRAVFNGGASFNTIQCERAGFFRNAKFENTEKDIDFVYTRFGVVIDCTGAIFRGGANFNFMQCEGTGIFRNVKFENVEVGISFTDTKFGTKLDCEAAVFNGGANFAGMKCEYGVFSYAKFENKAKTYYFSYVNCNDLEFLRATFTGNVDFTQTKILGSLALWKTEFNSGVNLNCASLNTFSLADPIDKYGWDFLPFRGDVDLRRFSFTVFEGTKEQQKHIVDAQASDKFSMDPYLQFEKYYNSVGDESYAKDVYYEGRTKLRENALNKWNIDINWAKGKLILDYLNCFLVGYGAKLGRSFIYLFGLLIIGIIVFWSDEAMIPKSANANNFGFMMTIGRKFQDEFENNENNENKALSDELRQEFK
ncbi:MAG: hypothetical protein AAB116_10455, partial [Candidatus Poribacteria bacterium]